MGSIHNNIEGSIKRRTSHEPNQMEMRKTVSSPLFPSLVSDSAHEVRRLIAVLLFL